MYVDTSAGKLVISKFHYVQKKHMITSVRNDIMTSLIWVLSYLEIMTSNGSSKTHE